MANNKLGVKIRIGSTIGLMALSAIGLSNLGSKDKEFQNG